MKKLRVAWLWLTSMALALVVTFLTIDATVFAQTNPQPTPTRAPSGSNPIEVAPTDVPVEWSLFWVLMFFVALGVGLLFANWLVRRGTFDEPERKL